MSVYTDMACDAGYPFGTNENKQMASMLEEHERQAYEDYQYTLYLEDMQLEDMQEEQYREILFRKFS